MRKIAYTDLLGTALAEERLTRKQTQAEVAHLAGLTQSAWARLELGKGCTIENICKACQAYDIEPWELIKVIDDRANALRVQGHEIFYDKEESANETSSEWIKGRDLSSIGIAALASVSPVGLVTGLIAGGIAEYISRQRSATEMEKK